MAIQGADIADLVTTTLRDLGRGQWTDNSSNYRDTIATKLLLRKGKTKMLDDGYEIQWNRMNGLSNSARFVGLYAPDIIDVTNQMGTASVPWRHATWNFAHDFRELLMNRKPSQIVELIRTRRIAAIGSMIELFERALWRCPAVTNDTDIFGIPYWIVKSATAATQANNDGFNGLAGATHTTVAGINPTTDTRWRNYSDAYTAVSKDDFVRKARRMATYTMFKPLVENTPTYDSGEKTEYYTNYAVYGTLVEILESQNENLGMDIAPYENKVTFMRTPVTNVQELDLDTTNPFYQIAWRVFGVRGLSGAWMKESTNEKVSGQHTVSATFGDTSLNTICYDRRPNGVISNGTTMPA